MGDRSIDRQHKVCKGIELRVKPDDQRPEYRVHEVEETSGDA
jgi:hypothetical protein